MDNIELVGTYSFLSTFPISGILIAYILQYAILIIGRDHFEGHGYDVSLSSRFGDLALVSIVCISAHIIKQVRFQPTGWLGSIGFHYGVMVFCILVGGVTLTVLKPKHEMDGWHLGIVVPLFIFLLIISAPVLWLYGSIFEKCISAGLLLIWLVFFLLDIKTGRLNQREWIMIHNPKLYLLLKNDEYEE